MKISKNILTSTLAVMLTLSVMIGTLLFAYKYTTSHAVNNNSSRKGNGTMSHHGFQKNDGNKPEGGSSNGDFKKPEN
ncbi:hypothetical protein [Clostridium sp.]|uniref:hypothetical protein n=1 Tax=Clostridium sp. TaxID=1506 RepID=UPI003D6D3F5E